MSRSGLRVKAGESIKNRYITMEELNEPLRKQRELEKLFELAKAGIITLPEFETFKKDLIDIPNELLVAADGIDWTAENRPYHNSKRKPRFTES